MKPVIVCIVGKSGSGKTTVADFMQEKYGIKQIQSFTTRKPREMNEQGHTFVSHLEYELVPKEDILAYTNFGGEHYWTVHQDITEDMQIYVIDDIGLQELKTRFSDLYTIISIFVNRPEDMRDVSDERKARDHRMFKTPLAAYHAVIHNIYTDLESLYLETELTFKILGLIKKVKDDV